MMKSYEGARVRTITPPASRHHAETVERMLPRARCPGCGAPIEKEQLKTAVIERLLRNSRISSKQRVEMVRSIFPEDSTEAAERGVAGARRRAGARTPRAKGEKK